LYPSSTSEIVKRRGSDSAGAFRDSTPPLYEQVIRLGRVLFSIAIVSFGFEGLFWAQYGSPVRLPWFPANHLAAYFTGIALIAAGVSIALEIRTWLTAQLLGILFLFYVLLFELPMVIARPLSVGDRTVFFEALAISASALTLSAIRPTAESPFRFRVLENLSKLGPYLFGISSVVFGIDHFLVLTFIASLIPSWIPGALFWAYLTGSAFIAAGINIVIKKLDQLSATLLGTMFLLWFVLLHSPRVLRALLSHNPTFSNEWSSAFIALAMCGGSWLVASHAQQRRLRHDSGGDSRL